MASATQPRKTSALASVIKALPKSGSAFTLFNNIYFIYALL